MSTEEAKPTCQPDVAHARAKDLDAASNAKLALICGELTAGEIRTLRAMLSYILRPPAEGKLTGYEGMTNALETIRRSNEDVEQWLAQHIGNLRDGRDRMHREIYSLKRRVRKIEKTIY